MTSTFRVIFLASSVSQCAGRGAARQVDLGPTFMIQSLRVLLLLRHEYRRHLEYTSDLFVRIETCRNLAAPFGKRQASAGITSSIEHHVASGSSRSLLLIAAEKVRIQYRNMPTAFIGSAIICSLMGFALLTSAGLGKLSSGWLLCTCG